MALPPHTVWLAGWRSRLHTFKQLSPADRVVLLVAWVLLHSVSVLCRLIGVRACLRWLGRMAGHAKSANHSQDWVERQAWLVNRAAQYCLLPPTCMLRALTLWFMLTRQGVDCHIRIGVNKTAQALTAHAWVEWQGRPLLEPSDIQQQYLAFDAPLDTA